MKLLPTWQTPTWNSCPFGKPRHETPARLANPEIEFLPVWQNPENIEGIKVFMSWGKCCMKPLMDLGNGSTVSNHHMKPLALLSFHCHRGPWTTSWRHMQRQWQVIGTGRGWVLFLKRKVNFRIKSFWKRSPKRTQLFKCLFKLGSVFSKRIYRMTSFHIEDGSCPHLGMKQKLVRQWSQAWRPQIVYDQLQTYKYYFSKSHSTSTRSLFFKGF